MGVTPGVLVAFLKGELNMGVGCLLTSEHVQSTLLATHAGSPNGWKASHSSPQLSLGVIAH
jgi:hypothetical protein